MLAVFALVAGLWMTKALHGIHYAVVALVGMVDPAARPASSSGTTCSPSAAPGTSSSGTAAWCAWRRRWARRASRSASPRRRGGGRGRLALGLVVAGRAAPHLLLRALRLREHHRRTRPRCTLPFLVVMLGGGRAGRAGGAAARLLLEPERVPHALRDDAGADPLRRGLRDPARLVAAWPLCALPHLLIWGVVGPLLVAAARLVVAVDTEVRPLPAVFARRPSSPFSRSRPSCASTASTTT